MSLQVERDPTSAEPPLTFSVDMDSILYRDGWYFLRPHMRRGLANTWSSTYSVDLNFNPFSSITSSMPVTASTQSSTTFNVPMIVYHAEPSYLDLVIPNPCYRYGEFHDVIAVYIDLSVVDFAGEQPTELYYLQNGNWAGPYLVQITEEQLVRIRDASHIDSEIYTIPRSYNIVFHPDIPIPDLTIMGQREEINPAQQARDLMQNLRDIYIREKNGLAKEYAERTPEQSFEFIVKRHEIENAYHRSKELLKEWLTPTEYESMIRCDKVIIPSTSNPELEYIVHNDGGMIDVYRYGEPLERRCIHIDRGYTAYDCVLTQILLLKSNETLFTQISNRHTWIGTI